MFMFRRCDSVAFLKDMFVLFMCGVVLSPPVCNKLVPGALESSASRVTDSCLRNPLDGFFLGLSAHKTTQRQY